MTQHKFIFSTSLTLTHTRTHTHTHTHTHFILPSISLYFCHCCLSVCPSVPMFVCLYLSFCMSSACVNIIPLSVCLSVCLSVSGNTHILTKEWWSINSSRQKQASRNQGSFHYLTIPKNHQVKRSCSLTATFIGCPSISNILRHFQGS